MTMENIGGVKRKCTDCGEEAHFTHADKHACEKPAKKVKKPVKAGKKKNK